MSQVHDELAALTADIKAALEWAQLTGSEVLPRERVEPLIAAPLMSQPEPRQPPREPERRAPVKAGPAAKAKPKPAADQRSVQGTKASARWQALMDAPTTHTCAGPRDSRLLIIRGAGSSPEAEGMLDRMLTNVLKIDRQQVAVIDLVRDARSPADIGAGVRSEIASFSPQVTLLMGTFAVKALLREDASVSSERGRWQDLDGIGEFRVTHHPEGIIALAARGHGSAKRETFEDLKAVADRLS